MYQNNPDHYAIPNDCWSEFQARFKKLNKRAAKLGSSAIHVEVLDSDITVQRCHVTKDCDGNERHRMVNLQARLVTITGKAPQLEGFQFIARVEYLSDGTSTLFHTVPGSETKVDERFRSLGRGVCEHCNKVRSRKDTFIVLETATGKQTQVGRQCLADFTGINNPQAILSGAAIWHTFSQFRDACDYVGGNQMFWSSAIDVRWALELTSAYLSTFGWVPKSAGVGTPTAGLVSRHFGNYQPGDKERAEMRSHRELAETQEHQERAHKVFMWLKDELADKKNKSDYEHNLVTLSTQDVCEQKHLGIVCSAVAAYQRAMNQAVEYDKRRAATKSIDAMSGFVGTVGERLKAVSGVIEFVKALEPGAWGPRTLVKLRDSNGNVFTWFASGDRDLNPGEAVTFSGTVKKHDEYQGTKQTVLSRVTL